MSFSWTVRSRPHLEHLLDVILVLGIYDTIHIPLEDFDQVPGEDPESTELQKQQHSKTSLLLWSFITIIKRFSSVKNGKFLFSERNLKHLKI